MMRTLEWDPQLLVLRMIDQRRLPGQLEIVSLRTYEEVEFAIRDMIVRGAPAIGVAAGFGLALAGLQSTSTDRDALLVDLVIAKETLQRARPTAVNLAWALMRVLNRAKSIQGGANEVRQALIEEAQRLADEDVETNLAIARHGAELIDNGDTIIHHCNTGALATVDWGTALGVLRMAHEDGKHIHVLVDETRPRLQGARLTAWELQQYGIPFDIITDNMSGYFLQTGQVNKVIFGADRVAANGDVVNKVGSYMLALAANDHSVPVFSAFPCSTVDLSVKQGSEILIEERNSAEVLNIQFENEPVVPNGAHARNPAFDMTPNRLIQAHITEVGVIKPPFDSNYTLAAQITPN